MTTESYLEQIDRYEKMIQNKISEIQQLKTIACSITVSNDGERVQKTTEKDKLGTIVSKIVDMEREIEELVEKFLGKRNKIIKQIDDMENIDYYHVLTMRYVSNNTIEEIASKTNWSVRKVYDLKKKALKEFEMLYGNKYL